MTSFKSFFKKSSRHPWAFVFTLVILLSSSVSAQESNGIKLDMTIDIDPVGNASVDYNLSMPAQPYAAMKQSFGDAFHVIRSMESNKRWLETKNVDARFDDKLQSIISHCDASGLTRTSAPGKWIFNVGTTDDGSELIDIHDNQAIFAGVSSAATGGVMRVYTRINLPKGAQNVKFDSSRGDLTYDYEPTIESGDRPSARCDLTAQEHLMSSLAHLYATEGSSLFAARNIFTNDGDQRLFDYRVRFRIDGYSSWSPWSKCKVVYPGQAVLDYFHPVLDIEKMAELNGTRHAMVEIEFEYTLENGEKVTDSDANRIQILSRNEVIYSNRQSDQNLNWFESFDLAPYILTAFTNGTDPVIQQFAGRVSALAGGPASSLNSEHAVAYLNTMWLALQANHLAYQTSPSLMIDNHFGQHVKYGRDVLRNRAGTCIDLAILWASAAESVGLKPYIAIIPGHAFPIIELPNGNQLPIESTLIGSATLDQAVTQGFETLKKAKESGLIMIVDVNDFKNNHNVRSLDLPKTSEDVLVKWGYNLDELINRPAQQTQEDETSKNETNNQDGHQENSETDNNENTPNQETNQTTTTTTKSPVVGDWKMIAIINGVQMNVGARFLSNGEYASVMIYQNANGTEETIVEKGTFIDHGDYLEFHSNLGDFEHRYQITNGKLQMEFVELNGWLTFDKLQ